MSLVKLDTITILKTNQIYFAENAMVEIVCTQWTGDIHGGNITASFDIYDLKTGIQYRGNVLNYPSAPYILVGNSAIKMVSASLSMIILEIYGEQCISKWVCVENRPGWEIDGCGNDRANARCDSIPPPPPGDKKITLEVSKPPSGQLSFKPGDTITFTATTNLEEGTKITLRERFSAYDLASGNVSNGQVVLTKSAGQPAQLAYYVFGGGILIPYESNTVTVYISEAGDMKPPLDWKQLAMYGIAGIGGAIVLSSLLGRK